MQAITDTPIAKNDKKKWFFIISASLLLIILLIYLIFSIVSSKRIAKFFNTKLTQVELVENSFANSPFSDTTIALLNKRTFLTSQVSLLASDSLNLIVDLTDSTLQLSIDGVSLHAAGISSYNMSKFFKLLSPEAYTLVFSKPFIVESFESTIVREPITIKQAPKDTLEAASFFELPDTLINEYVAVSMVLNHNFNLTMRQLEKQNISLWSADRYFFLKKRIRKLGKDLGNLLHFRIPQAEPEILIVLPKDDLVTIFRALPVSAKVAIRLR